MRQSHANGNGRAPHKWEIPRVRRVLMTADTVGGVWTYALELANALGPHGVEVHLATMGAPVRPDQAERAAELPNVTLHESAYRLEWMEQAWEDVRAAGEWLLALERTVRPDVVHLNGYAHGALNWKAPTVVAAHSCVFSWFEAVRGTDPPHAWRRYHAEVSRGLHAADAVVSPSRAMLHSLVKHYGAPRRWPVIFNARGMGGFQPGKKEPIILTAGRLWDEAKNVRVLERIGPRLAWPVYLAGENRHPEGRGENGFSGLTALGFLGESELAGWMGRASIYALPARYEPFGLSALEAALSGCALVLGDIPSLREIWGDAALYAQPDDPAAWHEAITSLIERPAQVQVLSDAALTRAKAFDPARMASDYLELYQDLVLRRHAEEAARALLAARMSRPVGAEIPAGPR
jgi:glycogen synthase